MNFHKRLSGQGTYKLPFTVAIIIFLTAFTAPKFSYQYNHPHMSSGVGSIKIAGAPTEQTCGQSCHGGADNSDSGSLTITMPSLSATTAITGNIKLRVPSAVTDTFLGGFQLLATNGNLPTSNTQFGTFTTISTTCEVNTTTKRLNHNQQCIMTTNGGFKEYTWNFKYKAASGATNVKFYATGHGDPINSQGHQTYKTTLTISNPVPVKFSNFDIVQYNHCVQLNWTSEDEINVNHYSVEKSTDGINFFDIKDLPENSANNHQHDYTYTDCIQPNGFNTGFYRIKCTDNDQHIAYSIVNKITGTENRPYQMTVQPGITSGNTNLELYSFAEGKWTIRVYDAKGKPVIQKNIPCMTGMNTIPLDLSEVSAGIYFINMVTGDHCYTGRVIKK